MDLVVAAAAVDDTIELFVAVDRSISWLSIDLSLLAVDRSL
jgi:hypothetical protein